MGNKTEDAQTQQDPTPSEETQTQQELDPLERCYFAIHQLEYEPELLKIAASMIEQIALIANIKQQFVNESVLQTNQIREAIQSQLAKGTLQAG